MKNSHDGDFPAYKNPPVTEVVCGLTFKPLKDLKLPHIGLLWEKIRGEFPSCEHAPILENPWIDAVSGVPLPRILFIGKNEDRLIQFQQDKLYYNWRRRALEDEYPRFSEIKDSFDNVLTIFQVFLKECNLGELEPNICELSYVNQIPKGEGWDSITDVQNVFPDVGWSTEKHSFLPAPVGMLWQSTFELPDDNGRLSIKLQHVTRKIDNLPTWLLENTARGLGAEKSLEAVFAWFSLAHEWIVRGFADFTSTSVQHDCWNRDNVYSK